ncbi:YncE family protein, partial [Pedobacter sp.]|uniref:YncE family protein n=1 Tax=Pedobacter sp. TaxID=1411316 RepID=UPI002CC0A833
MNLKSGLFICLAIYALLNNAWAQVPTNNPSADKILLPNGWSLTPAGRSLKLGDLPLNIQLSHSKQLLAVTNNGQGKQSLQLIDPATEQLLDEISIGKSWYGLKFSGNDKRLYVSGGNDNIILAYPLKNNKFEKPDTLSLGKAWPKNKISPTGIEVDDSRHLLYTVTKEDNSLYIIDLLTRKVQKKIELGHEAYGCILSADRSELYISLWGGDKVAVYDTKTGTLSGEIPTESHPNELLLSKNGKYLFVANANSNSVTVIDLRIRKSVESISASLYPTKLTGSTTNGLALSPNGKTLYIANADNNCLAVFDVSRPGKSTSKGFIPTGWYPTSLKTVENKILVSNGKGFSSMANPNGPQPIKKDDSDYQKGSTEKKDVQYIGGLFKGTLSFVDFPDEAKLKAYSAQVYTNSPFTLQKELKAPGNDDLIIPTKGGQKSPIKHLFYIIKENRTYDQVLGDMKEGNGDSTLCIFPEKNTPNHHALAREF